MSDRGDRVTVPDGALELLLELAQTAGDIARRHFRAPLDVSNKGDETDFDPVTNADREVETVLRERIATRFPDHDIFGEEFADSERGSAYAWYLDPIDGTRSFMTGSPLWGSLVGFSVQGQPRLGALCQPVLGELFWGDGDESYLDDAKGRQQLHSSSVDQLGQATLYSTHPDMFWRGNERSDFERLAAQVRMTRFGGDCYNYGLLAAGFTDVVVESGLQSFDILPLVPILEGAGGVVSDWDGQPMRDGGAVLAAANPKLHSAALKVLGHH